MLPPGPVVPAQAKSDGISQSRASAGRFQKDKIAVKMSKGGARSQLVGEGGYDQLHTSDGLRLKGSCSGLAMLAAAQD